MGDQLKVALDLIEDCRRVIAAGKSQRWDVLKWAVAINLAIPAAIIAIKPYVVVIAFLFFAFSVLVAIIGSVLIFHYTTRMTGARNNAAKAYEFIETSGVNLNAMSKDKLTTEVTFCYDAQELVIFPVILLVSCIPSLLVALYVSRMP
jgi:hypothetical protein